MVQDAQSVALAESMTLDASLPAEPAETVRSDAAPTATPERIAPMVEAIVISSPRAASLAKLAQALGLEVVPENGAEADAAPVAPKRGRRKAQGGPTGRELVQQAIAILNEQYASSGRAFRIEAMAGGYRAMTLPDFAGVVAAYHGVAAQAKLSRAAVETLAIIAYRQPVTRATLEAIRGVACGEVIKTLMERKMVTIAGRAEELGRPLLYATSRQFLDALGLSSTKDLPSMTDLGLSAAPANPLTSG